MDVPIVVHVPLFFRRGGFLVWFKCWHEFAARCIRLVGLTLHASFSIAGLARSEILCPKELFVFFRTATLGEVGNRRRLVVSSIYKELAL